MKNCSLVIRIREPTSRREARISAYTREGMCTAEGVIQRLVRSVGRLASVPPDPSAGYSARDV